MKKININIIKKLEQASRLRQHGYVEQAKEIYKEILDINPRVYEANYSLSVISLNQGDYEVGIEFGKKALKINRNDETLYNNIGSSLAFLKRYDEALNYLCAAVKISPKYTQALFNKGSVLLEKKLYEESLVFFNRAIVTEKNDPEIYSNRSMALLGLGRYLEALDSINEAIFIEPNFPEGHYNKGFILEKLGKLDEAIFSYDNSISLNSENAEAYNNRGNILLNLKEMEDSICDLSKAIELKPEYPDPYNNMGNAYLNLNRVDEAVKLFERSIELSCDITEATFNRSLALLVAGNYESGFIEYESRWNTRSFSPLFTRNDIPNWTGNDDISSRSILLYAEQGIGDTIQFARFVKMVEDLCPNVYLKIQPPLKRLFSETFKSAIFVNQEDSSLLKFDYQCSILSLPNVFRTDLNTIPNPLQFNTINYDLNKFRIKSQNRGKLRIGLVCSGNIKHGNDKSRSISTKQLIEFLPQNAEYFSLQKEFREGEKDILIQNEISTFEDQIDDFFDTAALCSLMDLVITVDTSVAHLAGSMNIPTWILIPFCPDWRWLLDRTDSPWYPSVRLFRQKNIGDWTSPLSQISSRLSEMVFNEF